MPAEQGGEHAGDTRPRAVGEDGGQRRAAAGARAARGRRPGGARAELRRRVHVVPRPRVRASPGSAPRNGGIPREDRAGAARSPDRCMEVVVPARPNCRSYPGRPGRGSESRMWRRAGARSRVPLSPIGVFGRQRTVKFVRYLPRLRVRADRRHRSRRPGSRTGCRATRRSPPSCPRQLEVIRVNGPEPAASSGWRGRGERWLRPRASVAALVDRGRRPTRRRRRS